MLNKKVVSFISASLLAFTMAVPAFAHDGWSQTNTPIIAQGEVSYIDLLYGNHSNTHKSYRVVGQWNPETSKVYVTTPAGVKKDISSTRYYTGEPATEKDPAVNNGYVASFSSSARGAYIITSEGDSVYKSSTATSRTLSSAKSFVAVSDIPILDRVSSLRGFSKQVTPDRAELVPLFNPVAVKQNQQLKVKLLLKGKPLADTEINIIKRNNSEAQTMKTDTNGIASFKVGVADYYLVRTKASTNEKIEGQYDSTNYSATMTFTVQNGTVKMPAEKANLTPYFYVNGNLVKPATVSVKNGSTYVDASFIRTYINAGYKGKASVALRSTAEAVGATVEYLPAVGESRAAILIYTKK